MSTAPTERSARRALDDRALARVTQRLNAAAAAPWLHGEVARRMAERLPIIKLHPGTVIDWGAFLGGSRPWLKQAYPAARVLAVEAHARRRDATAADLALPWWQPQRWAGPAHQALAEQDLPPGQGELLWANMQLHGAIDPQDLMARWHQALAVDGFLMFSTLGPGTLPELAALYAQARWPVPFAPFVDMHDLGDMLVAAGFADPVMDQETLTLTWPSPQALLAELRSLGGNVDPARAAGLRTPRWRARLEALLAQSADACGRLALRFEVVYGHAFKAAPRPRMAGETAVPLQDMKTMIRHGRRRV
jgi:malonyl-CoA O-methyltransferase